MRRIIRFILLITFALLFLTEIAIYNEKLYSRNLFLTIEKYKWFEYHKITFLVFFIVFIVFILDNLNIIDLEKITQKINKKEKSNPTSSSLPNQNEQENE